MQSDSKADGYSHSSRDYLRRAKALLLRNDDASLFYAAFELRCGIEARLNEYAIAWDQIPALQREEWASNIRYKQLLNAFQIGDSCVRLAISHRANRELYRIYYYTPVTQTLKSDAGRLGSYLHALNREKVSAEYWSNFRTYLGDVTNRLVAANLGTLLGPVLLNQNLPRMAMEFPHGDHLEHFAVLKEGAEMVFDISYPDTLPDPVEPEAYLWQIDL